MACGCRYPVRFILLARRLRAQIERQRAVRGVFQRLVFRAEREAVERIRKEELLVVVQGQRPEPLHGRDLSFRKRDGVLIVSVKRFPLAVELAQIVLRFRRRVLVHARFADGGAVQVIRAPLRGIRRHGPAVTNRPAVVLELKERLHEFFLGGNERFNQRLLGVRILGGGVPHGRDPAVERFLTGQRRHLLHDHG